MSPKIGFSHRSKGVALTGLLLLIVVNYAELRSTTEEIQGINQTIFELTQAISEEARLLSSLELAITDPKISKLLAGPSPETLSSLLQKDIPGLAEASGGRLLATESLPSQADQSGLSKVGQLIRLSLDIKSLERFFRALQKLPYLVLLEGCSIRLADFQSSKLNPPLDVNCEIFAVATNSADRVWLIDSL